MKKRLGTILFIIYFLVAIIITHELLSYNKYNIIEYKNSYIVTLNDDSLYKKSDLSNDFHIFPEELKSFSPVSRYNK